ncbi:hypothetical protein SERLA73DRAFT_160454 [Serpula lacrymans var. lacrymans S7.3]|uniref:Major facilitator superfamily (MFS) profile domain-containing protein n=1 Tax=Serpula lacrymans var. lacrymans (strain S7.3) TaxID=936435 RepID=F8PY26_SERL3|nr:hypothetical protein SERLA73DRAFT_160454 [Serpula lacrymans var. lacrymans S7.3]
MSSLVTEPIVADENTAFSPIRLAESAPLLPSTPKKPFYRPRPLWLVPFALVASLTRGMTLASRVEVFTQLACNSLHGHDHELYNHTLHTHLSLLHPIHHSLDPAGPHLIPLHYTDIDDDPENDPRTIPSSKCVSDPAVQARAARTQTIMTTTMGALSALTTAWWGKFGERHGRTRVLAIATCGLFLTDLAFILVSTPHSLLSSHSHKLLIIAPILEGLSGGTSTLNGALTAYIADCTSPGSRARIFSRFSGVSFIGLALGPIIGAFLIAHPLPLFVTPTVRVGGHELQTVTSVFWVAITCSFVNLLLVMFVFPESLPVERRTAGAKARASAKSKSKGNLPSSTPSTTPTWLSAPLLLARAFLSPPLHLPPLSHWSLTFLALALFLHLLSSGVFQIKYLYAEHVYGWAAEKLSYYISFMGGVRALNLLIVLPFVITTFKPIRSTSPSDTSVSVSASASRTLPPTQPKPDLQLAASTSTSYAATSTSQAKAGNNGHDQGVLNVAKRKPTKNDLLREMQFDLLLMRCSIFLDVISHTLVVLAPLPPVSSLGARMQGGGEGQGGGGGEGTGFAVSEALFVGATSLSSLGSGVMPAVQSLALCTLQARALVREQAKASRRLHDPHQRDDHEVCEVAEVHDAEDDEEGDAEDIEPGALFGALAVLQAVGQTILGPILFSVIYASTVAWMPKAIFACAAGVVVLSVALTGLVRPEVGLGGRSAGAGGRGRKQGQGEGEVEAGMGGSVDVVYGGASVGGGRRKARREERRGRSRVSKDLRGGAASMSESDSAEIQALYTRAHSES